MSDTTALAPLDEPGNGSHRWLRLALWAIIIQALFWGFALVIRPPSADPLFERHSLDAIMLEAPDGALREARGRPDYYLGEGRSARFVTTYTTSAPRDGLVVFAPRYNRHAQLTINNQPVPLSDAPAWRGGRIGAKWVVPPALLRDGANRIVIAIERECCRAYLSGLIAAPPGAIDSAIRKWRLQSLVPAFGLMVLGFFGAGTCLILTLGAAYRAEATAAALAFFGMAMGGLWQADIFTVVSEAVYNAAGQMSLLATFAGLVALADRWFPGGPRFDRPLIGLSALFAILIAVGAFAADGVPTPLRAGLEGAIVLAANIAIIACIARGLRIDPQGWTLDAAVVLLVPSISLADLIDSIMRDPLTLSSAPLGVLGLAILLLLGIVRRARNLSARLENGNQLLEAQIAAKQAELEATAALLRQREAEAAVQDERARIMRDMHDGMGGQLLSVLMLSRDEGSPREAITRTVEQAIDDLRLLIDSLDSVGDTIDIALGQFRERAETKLRAAGMRLEWSNGLDGRAVILPPAAILAVYRIMQEAINNAVRHSGGSAVSIRIASDASGNITVVIADNGLPASGEWRREEWSGGRGLSNMRSRARAIGGGIAIEPTAGGTRVTLLIPASDPPTAAASI